MSEKPQICRYTYYAKTEKEFMVYKEKFMNTRNCKKIQVVDGAAIEPKNYRCL